MRDATNGSATSAKKIKALSSAGNVVRNAFSLMMAVSCVLALFLSIDCLFGGELLGRRRKFLSGLQANMPDVRCECLQGMHVGAQGMHVGGHV